jgi:hypothetical protein
MVACLEVLLQEGKVAYLEAAEEGKEGRELVAHPVDLSWRAVAYRERLQGELEAFLEGQSEGHRSVVQHVIRVQKRPL